MLIDSFNFNNVVKLLCKYRIKHAQKRRKFHLMRDISNHPSTNIISQKTKEFNELCELLPPKRKWLRLNKVERKSYHNTYDLNRACLEKTIKTYFILIKNKKIEKPNWFTKLEEYIEEIQSSIRQQASFTIEKPEILPIPKEINHKKEIICRPIAKYKLKERIVLSLTAKYLVEKFDPYFKEVSFAFRHTKNVDKIKNHHEAFKEIINFRNKYRKKRIWVAECDLIKFFDCINHKIIKEKFLDFVSKINEDNIEYDDMATKVFEEYLKSYSFTNDVLTLNGNSEYFKAKKLNTGKFEWAENKLSKHFYTTNIKDQSIGVPQGGALSCLIANLILHAVDEEVINNNKDDGLLYVRYCDDMVLANISKSKCNEALKRYQDAVFKAKLLAHSPAECNSYNKKFWKIKSKKPYRWAKRGTTRGSIPWLSFVGYQLRYDGCMRVRKKSIEKEVKKQRKEITRVLEAVRHLKPDDLNQNSRKSKKQILHSVEQRFIYMSVGKINLYENQNLNPQLCWANGFKILTPNHVTEKQLRFLDKNRGKNLYRLKNALTSLTKESQGSDKDKRKYKHHNAFSYHNFVKKKYIRNKEPMKTL